MTERPMALGKWMTTIEYERPKAKTQFWEVRGSDSSPLGTIHWYGAWRQYVFFPNGGTVLNVGCITDLAGFIGRANLEHRERLLVTHTVVAGEPTPPLREPHPALPDATNKASPSPSPARSRTEGEG